MSICCCLSDEPIDDPRGRIRNRQTGHMWKTNMMESPFASYYTPLWFLGQFCPFTCCITQYLLRRKVLNNDLSKYTCCQGYFNFFCFKSGSLGEDQCPHLCLCLESFFCNNFAVSASRMYVQDKYQLSSDPCDYRLIRLSNFLQMLSCICQLIGKCDRDVVDVAAIIDRLADLMYHLVSSCMTAQTAHECNCQDEAGGRDGDWVSMNSHGQEQSPFFGNYKLTEAEPVPAHAYGYRADPYNPVGSRASAPPSVTATPAYTYQPTAPPYYYGDVKDV